MDTSLIIKSVEQGTNRKLQKTITDVNPAADGTALKTWAQGLNNLTTNAYSGTTKINIDNLLDDDTGGGGSGEVNPLPAPNVVFLYGKPEESLYTGVATIEFTDATGSFSAAIDMPWIGFVTDSTGNLNVTDTPRDSAAVISKKTTWSDLALSINYVNTMPEAATAIENPKFWMIALSIGDLNDATNSLGEFTFLFNATDTHSSATVKFNLTSVVDYSA